MKKKAQPKNLSLESEEYKDKYTSRWFQQIPCSNIKLTNSSWSANHVQATALDVINVGIHRYIHKSATFRFRNNKTKLGPPIHKPIKFYHAFLFFCIFLFMFFKIFLEPICDTCRWTVCTGDDIWCSTDCPTFYWRNFRPFAPLGSWGQMDGEVILDLGKVTLTPPIKVIWGHKDRKMPHMHKPFQFNASPDTP